MSQFRALVKRSNAFLRRRARVARWVNRLFGPTPPPQIFWQGVERLETRLMLSAVSWDGGAGADTSWNNPLNWSANVLPGSADDVTINVAANPTINLTAGNVTVKSLTTNETLTIGGGSLTISGAATINSSLTLNSDSLSFGAAAINGTGTITNNATLTLADKAINVALVNNGTLTINGTSKINNSLTHNSGSLSFGAAAINGTGTLINNATLTLADNEPIVTVVATKPAASETNGQTLGKGTFTFTRVGGSTAAPLTVKYSLTGTATNDVDFNTLGVGPVRQVVIPIGKTTATVDVLVKDDAVSELSETAIVTILDDPSYRQAVLPAQRTAKVTIADNEPIVTVVATKPAASETNGQTLGKGTFTFTRVGGSTVAPLIVKYSLTGTATNDTDFNTLGAGPERQVIIPIGKTTVTLDVLVKDDAVSEPSETAIVTILDNPSYRQALLPAQRTATVNIADNEPSISIVKTKDATETLGTTFGKGTFMVTRTGGTTTGPLTVKYAVANTSTAGAPADFKALSGTVVIPIGKTFATFDVLAEDDALVEPVETVIVNLTADPSYKLDALLTKRTATVNIADNEPIVTVVASKPAASETNGQTLGKGTFTFTRIGGSILAPLTVKYALTGTATNDTDFNSLGAVLPRQVVIPIGKTTATVDVLVKDDAVVETSETAIVSILDDPSYRQALLPAQRTATVNIADNEPSISIVKTKDATETLGIGGQTPALSNYTSKKYVSEANRLYNLVKADLFFDQSVIINSSPYASILPVVTGNPPLYAPNATSTADGFLAENEFTANKEKFYETPKYIMDRFMINNIYRLQGKSIIMDADPDLTSSDPNVINANKMYALAMYYISSNDCTFLSWPWRNWNDAISRDIGDPYINPKLIDSDHEVFMRKYTNAMILIRPNNKYNSDYNDQTSEFVYTLPFKMRILSSDNTLSDLVSKVTLKPHQGVILIKNPDFVRGKTVNESCALCKNVGTNRLFPHILTYGTFGTLNDGNNNLISDEELASARMRYDVTNTNNYSIGYTLKYINFSDKQENYKTIPKFKEIAKFFSGRGKNFANAFVYYTQDVHYTGNELYLNRDTLENKFTAIIQDTDGSLTDITAQAFGTVKEEFPATPENPKTYDILAFPSSASSISIGNFWPFGEINFNILNPKSADEKINFEYFSKYYGWRDLPISSDGTSNFAQSGKVTFEPPSSWQQTSIGDDMLYWVRLKQKNVPQGGGLLKFQSVTKEWGGVAYQWTGTSAISGESYLKEDVVINGKTLTAPIIPGWNNTNDINGDGIINNGEVIDPNASAKFRYMARVPSRYFGNRWVMYLGNPTYQEFVRIQANNEVSGSNGLFIDNVWGNIPDIFGGTKNYIVGSFH